MAEEITTTEVPYMASYNRHHPYFPGRLKEAPAASGLKVFSDESFDFFMDAIVHRDNNRCFPEKYDRDVEEYLENRSYLLRKNAARYYYSEATANGVVIRHQRKDGRDPIILPVGEFLTTAKTLCPDEYDNPDELIPAMTRQGFGGLSKRVLKSLHWQADPLVGADRYLELDLEQSTPDSGTLLYQPYNLPQGTTFRYIMVESNENDNVNDLSGISGQGSDGSDVDNKDDDEDRKLAPIRQIIRHQQADSDEEDTGEDGGEDDDEMVEVYEEFPEPDAWNPQHGAPPPMAYMSEKDKDQIYHMFNRIAEESREINQQFVDNDDKTRLQIENVTGEIMQQLVDNGDKARLQIANESQNFQQRIAENNPVSHMKAIVSHLIGLPPSGMGGQIAMPNDSFESPRKPSRIEAASPYSTPKKLPAIQNQQTSTTKKNKRSAGSPSASTFLQGARPPMAPGSRTSSIKSTPNKKPVVQQKQTSSTKKRVATIPPTTPVPLAGRPPVVPGSRASSTNSTPRKPRARTNTPQQKARTSSASCKKAKLDPLEESEAFVPAPAPAPTPQSNNSTPAKSTPGSTGSVRRSARVRKPAKK